MIACPGESDLTACTSQNCCCYCYFKSSLLECMHTTFDRFSNHDTFLENFDKGLCKTWPPREARKANSFIGTYLYVSFGMVENI